jgi:hypothetical protein
VNPFKALFGKGEVGPRPDLASFVPAGTGDGVLVIDGSTPPAGEQMAAELAGCIWRVHELAGPEGVPFREGDGRSLPTREGGWSAIVLIDTVDRVLEPAIALRGAASALSDDGCLVVIQQVAPDDLDARGAWNALSRLRDARHTWTPTRRQVRAVCGDAGFTRESEALWEESVTVRECVRPGSEHLLLKYIAALEVSGLVVDGAVALRRIGLVLRPR